MNQTITARRLLTDIGSVEYPVLTIQDGRIADIFSDPIAGSEEITTLTAMFFDVHTHGAMGHDVMRATPDQLSTLQRFLATRGVAHYLPTTVTTTIDATLRAMDSLANAVEAGAKDAEAQPVGIHLEGPFLSHAKRGMHPPEELQKPSIELFDRFWQAARGHVTLMTVAPEPNASGKPDDANSTALDLIRHATALGVRCSLGHTNATSAETIAGIEAGAASATHTFNAMRALDHREPGVLGTVLTDDRLFAEMICDGVHVAPAMVKLWLKMKGPERGILITDAMEAAGMPDGDYTLGDSAVKVVNGRALLASDYAQGKETLAGSTLTMDVAIANLRSFTSTPLAVATRLASHNPAAMVGLPELTRLAPGSPANLNRFSAEGKLIATYLHGKQL